MADNCGIRYKPDVDTNMWKLFVSAQKMDWFLLYKNTNPLPLTKEEQLMLWRIRTVWDVWKELWIYADWIPLTFEDAYEHIKKYLADYWQREDFMWWFRVLYWEDEQAFKRLQSQMRDDLEFFFHIIESAREKWSQEQAMMRLIKIVRDNEYNDMWLWLAIKPNWHDIMKNRAMFEAYFWISFKDPKTRERVKMWMARRAWRNADAVTLVPYSELSKKKTWIWRIREWAKEWPASSYTMYEELPDEIKVAFMSERFKLPEWKYLQRRDWTMIWQWNELDSIFITNDEFMKYTPKEQENLYRILFDSYFKLYPEAREAMLKRVDNIRKVFMKHYRWATAMAAWQFVQKIATNWILYSVMLIAQKLPIWLLSLISLNSWLFWPRAVAKAHMHMWLEWDWWKFIKDNWIFWFDVPFWEALKDWWDNNDLKNSISWIVAAMTRSFDKLVEAQFFNVTDVALTSSFRASMTEEFIRLRYPWINSFEEFSAMLNWMWKQAKEKVLKELVEWVDDRMYLRINNSIDTKRDVSWWRLPRWKASFDYEQKHRIWQYQLQEITNMLYSNRMFYRRYMVTYSNNVFETIHEWLKNNNTGNQLKERMEKYYKWEMSWEEVERLVNESFTKNLDYTYLINTALYSFLFAKMIQRYDMHWNWYEESATDDSVWMYNFNELFELFFFPIEAMKKTRWWMWLDNMFDAMAADVSLLDKINISVWLNAQTYAKQMFKADWALRWLVRLFSDRYHNKEQWAEMSAEEKWKQFREDSLSWISWFWYYLLDDISREWFQEYTVKTSTPRLKDIFWIRDYSLAKTDELSKMQSILKIDDWKSVNNFIWNKMPYLNNYQLWEMAIKTWVQNAMQQWFYTNAHATFVKWKLPDDVTDDQYATYFKFMTHFNPTDINDIDELTLLTDFSYIDDEWTKRENRHDQAKENIWNKLALWEADENLVKEIVRLLDTVDKTKKNETYKWQALEALLYLDAQTPWAWTKLLWYYLSSKAAHEVFFSWKYWYFEKQDNWEYSALDKAKQSVAFRQEQIKLAKQYAEYMSVIDKDIWVQMEMKYAKDSWEPVSDYIKDTNEWWLTWLWIYPTKEWTKADAWADTNLLDTFKAYTLAQIMSAEWELDWYKIFNQFSQLYSESWKKEKWEWNSKSWKLTDKWYEAQLRTLNEINWLTKSMWLSDFNRIVLESPLLMLSDQFASKYIEWKTYEEVKDDPLIQTYLNYMRWTAKEINRLADRATSEVVAKQQNWTDPSDISLSFVTNTKTKKSNKRWYSNWKDYYNHNKYFFDQVKYLTNKYHKYYNYLYIPKKSNAESYYSKAERDAKKFWPALATIKWSWGGWRRDSKQQKPWWSLTQRRWKARPFTNRWDLDKIPDRRTKPKNRRTRAYAVGSKLWNKLIPWRRRYIKARQRDIPTIT